MCARVLNRGNARAKNTSMSRLDFSFCCFSSFSSFNSTSFTNLSLAHFQSSGVNYIVCKYMCITFESDCEADNNIRVHVTQSIRVLKTERALQFVCHPRHDIIVDPCMGLRKKEVYIGMMEVK